MTTQSAIHSDWQLHANFNPGTLNGILRWRATQQPDQLIYTFLTDEDRIAHLTHVELDRRARTIAALLQQYGAGGERVMLLYPPGLEYLEAFFGCLYAGAIAVPAYPSRANRQVSRLQAIAVDSDATIALTTKTILKRIAPETLNDLQLGALRWVVTDDVSDELSEQWREPEVGGDSLAFLQYTSGSTSAPKGVMVSHSNLIHNERMIQLAFDISKQDAVVSWLPLYHDMGLIGMALQALYIGAHCLLMSPAAFLQRPVRWLQAISDSKASFSGAPNFAYDLCVRKITPAQRATLDLSNWVKAFNGSEPIRHATLKNFAEAFEPCGFRHNAFYPVYGLAEATLFVFGDMRGIKGEGYTARSFETTALEKNQVVEAPASAKNVTTLVSCGHAYLDQQVIIVNPETLTRCRSGEVGEIWVAGPSVAQGYWHKPEQTEQTFRAFVADTGEGPFLRTGDFGFLHREDLFVAGRLKDLLIFGGSNYYPQDIELTVEKSCELIQPAACAAFSIEVDGEERLVVMAEVNRRVRPLRETPAEDQPTTAQQTSQGKSAPSDVKSIMKAIRQAVSEEHDLQVYGVALVRSGSIPRTSSGKIQRYACRVSYLNGTFASVL